MPESFDIFAEVGYFDALFASLARVRRRAPLALGAYGLALGASVAASWLVGGVIVWLAAALALTGAGIVALVAGLTHRDFRKSGGRPKRFRYHVCESGVEIRSVGRGDWVIWEDLWDFGETSRSFVLSPSPGEQYVIPKRCCDGATVAAMRESLRMARGLAART